jgi:molybdopterin molybdotransferase
VTSSRYDEALARLLAACAPRGAETVALEEADGRVLAETLFADRDQPAGPTSAMDGYAVRDADVAGGHARLRLAGVAYAGQPSPATVSAGACVRVLTGALIPAGADRVVVSEACARDGEHIAVCADPAAKRHIRVRGADFRRGEVLVPHGRRLDAASLVAAAAADRDSIRVHRRPLVGIIAIGDELVAPGQARDRADRVPDTLSLAIASLCRAFGGEVAERRRAPDDPQVLRVLAAQALEAADVVVVIGGASHSERDFARAMFRGHDPEPLFASVAIRPGKPVWASMVGERLVIGLPGNPTAALVTARILLAPALAAMSGWSDPAPAWAPRRLLAPLPPCGAHETFLLGQAAAAGVVALANQDSSNQRALGQADALIRRPWGDGALEPDSLVMAMALG